MQHEDHVYNFIYDFDKNGMMNKENTPNNSVLYHNDTYISCFDLVDYIDEIKKSYTSNQSILSQFEKDYHRQSIHINKVYYENINIFFDKLKKVLSTNNYDIVTIFNMSFYDIIILLCCQSSFVLPYIILQNFYELNNESKLLTSEFKNKMYHTIHITINDTITIEMNTTLCIKDIEENVNTHKIDMTVSCEFHKNMQNTDPHFCVFTWKCCNVTKS